MSGVCENKIQQVGATVFIMLKLFLVILYKLVEILMCYLQYLSTPESQSLRCDLIRYICCVFHPSNELLGSDIIPRWAVIGWLLQTCTVRNETIPHTCRTTSIVRQSLNYHYYLPPPR